MVVESHVLGTGRRENRCDGCVTSQMLSDPDVLKFAAMDACRIRCSRNRTSFSKQQLMLVESVESDAEATESE